MRYTIEYYGILWQVWHELIKTDVPLMSCRLLLYFTAGAVLYCKFSR